MTDPHPDPMAQTAEKPVPTDGSAPVPSWYWVLFVAIGFVCALFLGMNSGGFSSEVFNPQQVSWAGGGGAAAGPPDPKVVGKRLFTQNCAVCHQASGEGMPGQYPPLVDSEWVLGGEWHGDNHLVRVILNGLTGPVQVKGESYNNNMVPWRDTFNDEQIAAILTYVRSEWGNEAAPISADFVAKVRAETEGRGEPWTQKALQEIPREAAGGAAPAPAEEAAPEEGAAPPENQEPAPEAPAEA